MGILSNITKQRKERAGFRRIVAEKTKTAERQSFAAEAEKQARLRGERRAKEKINRPSLGERVTAALTKQRTASPTRKAPRKRIIVRKPTITRRRTTPTKIRTLTRRRTTPTRRPTARVERRNVESPAPVSRPKVVGFEAFS